MKRTFPIALCLSALTIWSCSDNNNTTASGANADSSSMSSGSTMTTGSDTAGKMSSNTQNMSTPTSGAPLSKMDSMFVMDAAVGGMEEVAMGQVAAQNAASDRVKAFGTMMVADHSKANDELKGLASSHGLMVPAALPAAKQKEVDAMQKMTGKAFDAHYLSMMMTGHEKTIAMFKKAAADCNNGDLKNWAAKTVPTIQMHIDSLKAIRSAKM